MYMCRWHVEYTESEFMDLSVPQVQFVLPPSLPSSFRFKKGTHIHKSDTHIAHMLTLSLDIPYWPDCKLEYFLRVHCTPEAITPVGNRHGDRGYTRVKMLVKHQ